MPIEKICWGIPGAGKTTFGVKLSKYWMETEGVRSNEIAYLAFTKAAAKVAITRVAGSDPGEDAAEAFPLFRTIHSLSYMGQRQYRKHLKVVDASDMKKFAQASGLEGAYAVSPWEDLADVYSKLEDRGRTHWDQALMAYGLSRISAGSVDELNRSRIEPSRFACLKVGFIEKATYQAFVSKYEAWKQTLGLVDFTDMLEFALRDMPPLDYCRKVIIDEAQDLCPLHHAIIDKLFRGAEEIWWIGDEDQAIFSFSGATAELFLKRADSARYNLDLQRTNRYGQEVVDFSQKVIRRVQHRRPKTIIGVDGKGGRIGLSGRFEPIAGDVFLLHRHVLGCQKLAQAYIDAGLPFRNERGKDPLGSSKRVKCWQAVDLLASGRTVSLGHAKTLVEEGIPSLLKDDARTRAVVHGAKRRLDEEVNLDGAVKLSDLVGLNILTEAGAKLVADRRFDLMEWPDDLSYYERVVKNGHSLTPKNVATITTMHGSKGREADDVVAFSPMGSKCWDDPDTEHRLAYVAVTRAKFGVTICADDLGIDWARTRYDYPVEK